MPTVTPASTGLLSDIDDYYLSGGDMNDSKNIVETSEHANPWNVFISGNVLLAQDFSDPTDRVSHANSTTGTAQAGADYRLTHNFLVGAMFAFCHTEATLDNLGSNASVDTYSPGVYASYSNGGWYANAVGSQRLCQLQPESQRGHRHVHWHGAQFARRRPDASSMCTLMSMASPKPV